RTQRRDPEVQQVHVRDARATGQQGANVVAPAPSPVRPQIVILGAAKDLDRSNAGDSSLRSELVSFCVARASRPRFLLRTAGETPAPRIIPQTLTMTAKERARESSVMRIRP